MTVTNEIEEIRQRMGILTDRAEEKTIKVALERRRKRRLPASGGRFQMRLEQRP